MASGVATGLTDALNLAPAQMMEATDALARLRTGQTSRRRRGTPAEFLAMFGGLAGVSVE